MGDGGVWADRLETERTLDGFVEKALEGQGSLAKSMTKDKNMTSSEKPKRTRYIQLLIASGIVCLWSANWLFLLLPNSGPIGDVFGIVNSLFSGLAFAYLIFSVRIQREELELTREELKGQREELNEQNATFHMQQFENTFFELIKVHNQIIDSIQPQLSGSKNTRRAAFRYISDELKDLYEDQRNDSNILEITAINRAYEKLYEIYQEDIGHYFRNLYHILKFAKETTGINAKRYTSLLRAQISSYEFVLIFYNCVSRYGIQKFKPLLEEYAFLENMSKELLFRESHLQLYQSSAFGEHP